ncbi:MAG: hypothetical protein KAX15_03360 [Candidatus Omnitrophica bacterium]|nr:hypothetical protein [Candidatus Omnitrophota bacterium]
MNNVPELNLGIIAVSRDCFPIELSQKRRAKVVKECRAKNILVTELKTVVENEKQALTALEEIEKKNIN